jgi:hypothetical protein
LQSNGHIDYTTKEDSEFEPSINEPHEGVPVIDDEQLRAFPENEEEEKEEIPLPTTAAVGILSRPIAFALRAAVIAPAAPHIANLESFSLMYMQVNTADRISRVESIVGIYLSLCSFM